MNIKIEEAAQHLSEVIQIKSLSSRIYEEIDFEPFFKIHQWLKETYPLIHQQANVEVINTGALLYTFKAKAPKKLPLLFMAHMDVVPIDEKTADQWKFEAFSGTIDNRIIYGRGAKDMKNQMVAFFEATELALKEGKEFDYDLYFCLGYDEENGGRNGMAKIVEHLKQQGIRIGTVIDEGGTINNGVMGIPGDIALIGVCEKGFANVKITAQGAGGHSSMPPIHTALGKVCKAASLLEEHQMPIIVSDVFKEMMNILKPFLPPEISSSLDVEDPIKVEAMVANMASANALLRTTTAVTMAQGAPAPNVLPSIASVMVNFRIIPGDSIDSLLKHIREVIGEGFELELQQRSEPSKISSMDEEYQLLQQTIKEVCPELKGAVPFVMVGATDSKYFDDICDHIYKFGPFKCSDEELKTVHGVNEFLRFEDLELGIRFFYQMLHNYVK